MKKWVSFIVKSRGYNINDGTISNLIDLYGEDSLCYYLMRDMTLGQDANYNLDKFIKRYNSDLANDFGNLVNRITILIKKHFNSLIPKPGNYNENDGKCKEF